MLNRRNLPLAIIAGIVFGLLPTQAMAEHFVLICVPGGPGSQAEAQERIDLFLGELSKGTGKTLTGAYANSRRDCDKMIGEKKPQFALFAHGELAARGAALKATPLLEVIPQNNSAMRYHLVAQKGATLESIKGGKLLSPHWEDEVFLSGRVFKMPLKEVFKGKRGSALRAIKKVAKGKADVALLNELEFNGIQETKFANDLFAVVSSPELPGVALVELGGQSELGRKVQASGEKVCSRAPAACKGVEMSALKPSDATRYDMILSKP